MPSRPQQRDPRGRFVRNSQPQENEEDPQTPQTQLRQNRIQRALTAAHIPLTSDVPESECISNIASALQHSLPDSYTPAVPQLESTRDSSSSAHHIPPPRYATDTPLPRPDFNAPGSDDSETQVPPDTSQLEDNQQTRHSSDLGDNELSSDDELLETLPLLQPTPRRLLPRFHSRLSEPLPPLPTNPPPSTTMATHGVSAMPSPRSKTALCFSGEIHVPIEDFLKEYEELADGCRLTQWQKVETVIRYVSTSQHHIWTSLAGFAARDWNDLCRDLRKEYISPSTQGRYSKRKLVELANRSAELPMEEEADVINYHRDFNTLSKPLIEAG